MRPPAEIVELKAMPAGEAASAAAAARAVVPSLARGTAIYVAANFGTKALNFFLLPLYTRFLSPADYGIINLAEIIATVLLPLIGLGLDPVLLRVYFHYPEGSREQRDYIGSVVRFSLMLVGSGALLMVLIGAPLERRLAPSFPVAFFPYIALAIGAAAMLQAPQYALTLLQAAMRPAAYARLAVCLVLVTAACVIAWVVFARRAAEGMLLGKFVAAAVMAMASAFLLRPWLRSNWHKGFLRETLPLALPLMPHQLTALGLVVADRFLLAHYRSLAEVGIYSVAYSCGMAMYLATTSLMQAWSPMFYERARHGDASRVELADLSSKLAQILIAMATLASLAAPLLVLLLDHRYVMLAKLIPLVIAAYLLHGFFSLLQLPILQSRRSLPVLYASAAALGANLALNILWIPRWGVFGAAYATIAGYALEAFIIYFFAQKIYPLPYKLLRVAALFAGFMLAAALTEVVPSDKKGLIAVALVFCGAVLTLWTLYRELIFQLWQNVNLKTAARPAS